MRQARYRVWDRTNKEWVDLNSVGLSLVRIPNAPTSWMVIIARDGNSVIRDDIEFHQNTDLYDDNGKEIYEADIVYAYKPNSGLDGLYVVTWDKKRGCWAYKNGSMLERYQVGKAGNTHCYVRGNIYDDPQLLVYND